MCSSQDCDIILISHIFNENLQEEQVGQERFQCLPSSSSSTLSTSTRSSTGTASTVTTSTASFPCEPGEYLSLDGECVCDTGSNWIFDGQNCFCRSGFTVRKLRSFFGEKLIFFYFQENLGDGSYHCYSTTSTSTTTLNPTTLPTIPSSIPLTIPTTMHSTTSTRTTVNSDQTTRTNAPQTTTEPAIRRSTTSSVVRSSLSLFCLSLILFSVQ